jgi:CheY-like chemotaxis protein
MFNSTLDISVAYPTESTLPGRRLLIVDDNHGIRAVLCWNLENAGSQVTPAASGEEAMDKMREKSFDLALLDINMPGMGGGSTGLHRQDLPADQGDHALRIPHGI